MNGALDELKKALIQSVENSENSNMDRQAVQKYFDKEIEPIRVKTDIAFKRSLIRQTTCADHTGKHGRKS